MAQPTLLTKGVKNFPDGATATSASISPGSGLVVLVLVNGFTGLDPTSIVGVCPTWTKVTSSNSFFDTQRVAIWVGSGSPTPGTVTFTWASGQNYGIAWFLYEFAGALSIVQSGTAQGGTATSPKQVTLSAFNNVRNEPFAAVIGREMTGATEGSGYTKLDTQSLSFGPVGAVTQWKDANDTTVEWTALTNLLAGYSDAYSMVACEIGYAPPAAPTVVSQAATSVTDSSAVLNGTVNANYADATVTFEIGTASDLSGASVVAATPGTVGGEDGVTAVQASATGLTAGTLYYFRAKAVNSVGTSYGSILSFTTLVLPPTFVSASIPLIGTRVTVVFDKAMADPTGKHGEFSLTVGGSAVTVTAAALDATTTTIVLTLESNPGPGAALLTYTLGTVVAADGGILQSFSNQSVTNGAVLYGNRVTGTTNVYASVTGTVNVAASITGTVDVDTVISGTVDGV